uniref:Cytochrome P450 n=1 Tax=Macrostomum lignano TaxID=282301 RepID=A0A1I8F2M7_9PLAT
MTFVLVLKPKLVQEGLLSPKLTNRMTSFYSLNYFTEGMNSIFSSPNNERWRYHRKSSYAAFRMFAQGERLEQFVIDSFDSVTKYFLDQDSEYKDVYETVYLMVYNLQCRMTFGSEYTPDDPEFLWLRKTLEYLNQVFQSGLLVDALPILRFLPIKSIRGFFNATDELLSWAKMLCEKRKASFNPNELNDILDFLIQEQRQAIASGNGHLFQDVHLRQTLMDIFGAGTDTTAMTLYWVIWGLCSFPEMQERCYAEVNSVFGDSTPRMSERHRLPYTDAFLHEVMRFWPLGGLIPRECNEDCQLGGYQLPRGTQVMLSTYRCHYDPTAFPDPHTFKPEHFLTENGELAPYNRNFFIFGAGTRVCLGESIAKKTTFLITTLLIQSFKFIQSPEFKDSDGYKESSSLLFAMPRRFKVRVVPRKGSMQALLSTNAWPIRLVPVENRKAAITAAAIAGASLATLWFVRRLRRRSRLPPGPRGWPLIGNVELFKATGRDAVLGTIDRLAEKYGDMTTVKFGALSFVLVFDPKLVQEGLLSKQLTNRFTGFYSLDYFTEGMNSIFAAPNSERWRFHRKSSYSAFRMFAQGERLEQFVVDSFDGVVKYFSGQESEYKDVYETVYLLVYNLQCRMTFSSEYTPDDPEFIWLRETMEFLNIGFQKGVIIDILPILRFLPFKSCRGFIDATDGLLSWAKKLCEKRKASFNPNELNDILDFLIQEQRQAIASGNDVHLRQTLIDIFTAGTDTLAMTLYWVIWGLCSFPEMQERCYAEVNSVFGDSTPRMSERHRLPYTDAFLHEVMRFWPLGPLVPRECSEDCQLGGYQLPRGTQVMLSTYRSSFDPTAFPDPHTFKPEHFLTEKGELAPHKQGYMPFGAGTRVCLGESIAKKTNVFNHYAADSIFQVRSKFGVQGLRWLWRKRIATVWSTEAVQGSGCSAQGRLLRTLWLLDCKMKLKLTSNFLSVSKLNEFISTKEPRTLIAGAATVAAVSAGAIYLAKYLRYRLRYKLPPGPFAWPLVGTLEVFNTKGRKGAKELPDKLAENYGDMVTISLGNTPMVLVLNPDLVLEGLLSKQLTNRSSGFYSFTYATEDKNDIFAAPNSERLRYHRKSAFSAFRVFAQADRLEQFVVDSFDSVAEYFVDQSNEPKDVYETVYLLIYNLQCRMTFSTEYTPQDAEFLWLRNSIEGLNQSVQKGLLIDLLPSLRFLPLQSTRRFYKLTDGLLSWAKELCEKRQRSFNPSELNDILDFLVKEQREAVQAGQGHLFQDVHLRQTLMDIFTAGTDTTSMTLYWMVWALCDNPEMQERCYAEVNSVFGDSTPRMSERHRLPYTDAFLHEVMRFWPLVTMIPRECYEDCQLGGYQLPRGTQVMLSTYRCHFDPKNFPDPHTFKPEHFLTEKARAGAS